MTTQRRLTFCSLRLVSGSKSNTAFSLSGIEVLLVCRLSREKFSGALFHSLTEMQCTCKNFKSIFVKKRRVSVLHWLTVIDTSFRSRYSVNQSWRTISNKNFAVFSSNDHAQYWWNSWATIINKSIINYPFCNVGLSRKLFLPKRRLPICKLAYSPKARQLTVEF